MATNDTKVHTRDAQFPPISETARTMTAALSVSVSSPQADEDKFPNVVQALKITARPFSQRVSWKEKASGAARTA
jgi:hypothetical protein